MKLQEDTLFSLGYDLEGKGIGPVADGILPVISTPQEVYVDSIGSGFTSNRQLIWFYLHVMQLLSPLI